jgi:hypothetical protein
LRRGSSFFHQLGRKEDLGDKGRRGLRDAWREVAKPQGRLLARVVVN